MSDWESERSERNAHIDALIAELGITIVSEFVPFSRSRSKDEKLASLNWRVSLYIKRSDDYNQKIATFDYTAGQAHCPSYQQRQTVESAEGVAWECEHGKRFSWKERLIGGIGNDRGTLIRERDGKTPILPDLRDVLYSLVSDSDVLDSSTFEEWASGIGYDPDSRKAEGIYRECLSHALVLRNGLGEANFARLREAFQDY